MSDKLNPSTLDIIGRALTFPLQLDAMGRVVTTDGWDVLRASVVNILTFDKRFFLYQFGVGIENFLQEPNDAVVESYLEYQISEQLNQFDRRVRLLDLKFERTNNDVGLKLTITIGLSGTDLSETFVWPYYKEIIY